MVQITSSIDALRNKRGWFSMLAIDQRDSLRTMLANGTERKVTDDELVAFKSEVATALTPFASGVLLDRDFGSQAAAVSECPVILAADVLSASSPGGPVDRAEIDPGLTAEMVRDSGAAALKMLVPWLPENRDEAMELSERFLEFCQSVGLPGVVEGVVRPVDLATWSDERRNQALVDAARDLGSTRPDLYKAEVPQYGLGAPEDIEAAARRITESLESPWVVLSSGVAAADFPRAVDACMRGGASGFLAGRAIWADAIRSEEPSQFLKTESVRRLRALAEN